MGGTIGSMGAPGYVMHPGMAYPNHPHQGYGGTPLGSERGHMGSTMGSMREVPLAGPSGTMGMSGQVPTSTWGSGAVGAPAPRASGPSPREGRPLPRTSQPGTGAPY